MGSTPDRMQSLLDLLRVSPVFTAHPTEAKRATIRQALRRLRHGLRELDRPDLSRHERQSLLVHLQSDLACLWETDSVRPRRPTVLEEVYRNLAIVETLWEVVPRLYHDLRAALQHNYGDHPFRLPRLLRFGTWIGGDRDGNPFVTAEVTRQTLVGLRREAMKRHLAACQDLSSQLSVSDRYHPIHSALADAIRNARQRWPSVEPSIAACHPHEPYRHWLAIIGHRLEATAALSPEEVPRGLAYRNSQELACDVRLIYDNLLTGGHTGLAEGPVQEWLARIEVIGFQVAELDIRDESVRLQEAVAELARASGLVADFLAFAEPEKQAFLLSGLDRAAADRLDRGIISPEATDTLDLMRLIQRTASAWGRNRRVVAEFRTSNLSRDADDGLTAHGQNTRPRCVHAV